MIDVRLAAFACPRCHGDLDARPAAWGCRGCGAAYRDRDGVVDLAPGAVALPGMAGRIAESAAVARLCADVLRPALTRFGAHLGYGQERAFVERHFRPVPGPLLDLGCGVGQQVPRLAQAYGAGRVIALDASAAMLARARQEAPGGQTAQVLFVRGTAVALPFRERSLGGVSCFGARLLLHSPVEAIRRIAAALRPGAPFVCVNASRTTSVLHGVRTHALSRSASAPSHAETSIEDAIRRSGLQLEEVRRDRMVVMIAARKV